jgi:septal ring-binding cell division protein DamX
VENWLWERMWTTRKRDYVVVVVVVVVLVLVVIVVMIVNYNYDDQSELKRNSSDNLQCRKSN